MEVVMYKFMIEYWRVVIFQVQQGLSKIFLRVLFFFKASAIKQLSESTGNDYILYMLIFLAFEV